MPDWKLHQSSTGLTRTFAGDVHQEGVSSIMSDDCNFPGRDPLCPDADPPRPINLPTDPPPDNSGFIIVRLKPGAMALHGDLAAAAK
jgi:hypothetical protein